MTKSVEEQLCTQCGLCCDGTFLDDVELAGDEEAIQMESLGFLVDEDDQPCLPLPCKALCGSKCGIYKHRPETCRSFECTLLQRTKSGIVSINKALTVVSQAIDESNSVRARCSTISPGGHSESLREHYGKALSQAKSRDNETYDCLVNDMAKLKQTIQKNFLG